MQRLIWLLFLVIGLYLLTLLLGVVDAWAVAAAVPGSETFCRGSLVVHVPVVRTPVCVAVWFIEAKSWAYYARDMLLGLPDARLYLAMLIRTADIALIVAGAAAGALAVAWIWATMMTRVAIAVAAALYTLAHGVSLAAGVRPRGWSA